MEMVEVKFRRRRFLTGGWRWPETATMPREGARRFCRAARHSKSHKILQVRRCGE
jgi:hypothetical protein